MKQSLSITFPAYNEEANIEKSVREAIHVASDLTDDFEVIVVDDGSKDRTGEIADRLALENKNVKVIHHNPNQGYGAAVWDGLKAATKDLVFFTDADLQFDLSEIKKLWEVMDVESRRDGTPHQSAEGGSGAWAVLGYRAPRVDPFMRKLNAFGWKILNRLAFGLKVKDIDCAFKLFRREVFEKVQPKSRGAMFSAELLIRMQRAGMKWVEVPVKHLPRVAGSPTGAKLSVILRAFSEFKNVWRELRKENVQSI